MKKILTVFVSTFLITLSTFALGQENSEPDSLKNISLSGLSFRSIGPAVTGGRVVDIAVNPSDHSEYYVASGHGSLWKTTNSGIIFSPVFDANKSYAIGCVAIDPTNPNVVWVGTGENNNQNNVIYGDGIYKSEDGGKSWKNMGLDSSDQIGGIAIDPNNSNIVYIAAYGSSRNSDGHRGIFKTIDAGKTWTNVLKISEYTGCYQVHMDPRFSNILYAVAHQRMRNLYTGVYGGPESGIYRSLDYGVTWEKLKNGLPSEDVGRIGMAISPVNPDYLYAIIEATEKDKGVYRSTDRGASWTKSSIAGLPEYARVHHIIASNFDKLAAYAACHNYVGGDYKPYIYKTTDGGKSWFSINSNLPENGSTYSVAEDHVDKNLLFIGTQFGVYFSNDGGKEWIPLKNGIPPACVMDLDIQRRENDLVVSTFGRGVYILDDYSPLRYLSTETLKKEAEIFPVKDALMFIPSNPFGFRGVAFQGASFYSAPNPEVGAVFTYYLKNEFKTLKEKRRDEEKEKQKKGEDIKYPTYNTLMNEQEEADAYLLFTISDAQGNVVRKIKTEATKGVNRITWNFRYTPVTPISLEPFDDSVPWNEPDKGYMVVPGKYFVSLSKFETGKFTELVAPKEFICKPLNITTLPAKDKFALDAFNKKVAELTRAITGADAFRKELVDKLAYLKKAVLDGAEVPAETYNNIINIESDLRELNRKLNGDQLRSRYEGAAPTSVKQRVELITGALWSTTAAPTNTFTKSYDAAASKFDEISGSLKSIDESAKQIESVLEKSGAPYTPGRFPEWRKK